MTAKRVVLVAGSTTVRFATERLPTKLETDWELLYWSQEQGAAALRESLGNADAMVSENFGREPLQAPKLGLLQLPFAGYEWLRRELLPAHCIVCNTYEHEIPIAEYVMLGMLEWQIGALKTIDPDFRRGSWRYCMPPAGPFHGEVYGKTLGFIGYGHIGKEIAKRSAAFGMRNIAVVSTPRCKPPALAWLGSGEDDLNRLLAESDFVVVTCPLNAQTAGMIDADKLARMKDSAVLVNVARGKIVAEAALYNALRDRIIAGAILDTWYRYPFEAGNDESVTPSQFPFHELDNVIMTPHCSAWTLSLIERRWDFIAANLDRFARAEPLQNIVRFESEN